MGGSGSGYDFISNPKISAQNIRDAERKSLDIAFETEINNEINNVLKELNVRPVSEINRHLDSIKTSLGSEIEGFIDLLYGGSVSKRTYVNGLSDIDALAVLNNTELKGKSPKEIIKYFEQKIKQRLPKTEISSGKLAVTVKYSDGLEIQILPAIKTNTGIKIASLNNNTWSNIISPVKFANKLTSVNKTMDGKVVPVIKLAKSIISSFPKVRRLSGYHIESLAIEIFKGYNGPKQTKSMLNYFFDKATILVKSKIRDSTGQSLHIDDYLGEKNSSQRFATSDSLSQLVRKMNNADASRNINMWKSLLNRND